MDEFYIDPKRTRLLQASERVRKANLERIEFWGAYNLVKVLDLGRAVSQNADGEIELGGGPAISLYSFHGRGTLNGTIPHPALPKLFADTAAGERIPLQRTAHTGGLTDSAYVQLVDQGVACIDVCFTCRYTHTALELCDLRDLENLTRLLIAAIRRIDGEFSLDRDLYT